MPSIRVCKVGLAFVDRPPSLDSGLLSSVSTARLLSSFSVARCTRTPFHFHKEWSVDTLF